MQGTAAVLSFFVGLLLVAATCARIGLRGARSVRAAKIFRHAPLHQTRQANHRNWQLATELRHLTSIRPSDRDGAASTRSSTYATGKPWPVERYDAPLPSSMVGGVYHGRFATDRHRLRRRIDILNGRQARVVTWLPVADSASHCRLVQYHLLWQLPDAPEQPVRVEFDTQTSPVYVGCTGAESEDYRTFEPIRDRLDSAFVLALEPVDTSRLTFVGFRLAD